MTRYLALCGKTGVGKSEVARYLGERHGYVICSTGRICRDISCLLFGDETTTHLHEITDALRTIDSSIFLRSALRNITDSPLVVIDCVRFVSDIDILRSLNGFLIRIEASENIRIQRLAKRSQIYDLKTDGSHSADAEADTFFPDFNLINSGSMEALRLGVEEILRKI